MANPSINSSLKGVNKNNIWFVNLLNYIQSPGINTNYAVNNSFSDISTHQIGDDSNSSSNGEKSD